MKGALAILQSVFKLRMCPSGRRRDMGIVSGVIKEDMGKKNDTNGLKRVSSGS